MSRKIKYLIGISILAILIIVLIIVVFRDRTLTETEPNDTFQTANAIDFGQKIAGYMNTENDKDFFKLVVDSDSILTIEITGVKGINLALSVWHGEPVPKIMKIVDDNRKSSPEVMTNLRAKPGIYYILVEHGENDPKVANTKNPYYLSVTGRDYIPHEESEPNDTPQTATRIEEDIEYMGYFSPSYNKLNSSNDNQFREEDWFVIHIANASFQTPKLLNISLSEVIGIDSIVYLYNSRSEELLVVDNNGTGAGEQYTGFPITQSGHYYIMVTAKLFASNYIMPYKLKYTLDDANPNDEIEPNDSMDTANPIADSHYSISGENFTGMIPIVGFANGKINRRGDKDYFKFVGSPGTYRIELLSLSEQDFTLSILSENGEQTFSSSTTDKLVHPNFTLTRGSFFLVTSNTFNEGSLGYTLRFSKLPPDQFMEIEPNDTKETANIVDSNKIRGYTSSKGDKDFFVINYPERLRCDFTVTAPLKGSIKFSVTDPLGYIMRSTTVSNGKIDTINEYVDKRAFIIVETTGVDFDNLYEININMSE